MVVLNTPVCLDENFVIDNSLRTMTPVTTSTILYRMDMWLLRWQSLKEYVILILPWYQQHYVRPIYRPTSELYQYDGIPLWCHVDHSISDKYRTIILANPILMKNTISISFQKRQRFVGPMYRPIPNHINTIQFHWEHDIDHSMSEIWLQHRSRSKYAIMISFRYHRLDIIILMQSWYSTRFRIHKDTM